MMELSKKTLMNVSFDRNLFHKELLKAIKWMQNSEDLKSFKHWCLLEFGHVYPSIIKKVFK